MFEINEELLNNSTKCEFVKKDEAQIEISYRYDEKELFVIVIKPSELKIKFIMKTQAVNSTDEMLFLLKKYQAFITGSLTLGNNKVFGDIIIGDEYDKVLNNRTVYNVKKILSYWKDVKSLEEKIDQKFEFNMPLSDMETEKIEILKNSFLHDRMTVIGNLKNVCITTDNKQQLEDSKGKEETLVLIINNPKEYVCGVNLGKFYKRIEYGPVKILDYETLEEFRKDDGTLLYKCLLDLEEQKLTKTEIRYFINKKTAEEYKKEG